MLYADKGDDHRYRRDACRKRGIASCIVRDGVEPTGRLGRRWVIERTMARLTRHRRLAVRYRRRADLHRAFLTLACCLACHRYFTQL